MTATLAVFVLLLVVLGVINAVNYTRIAEDADRITERLAEGRGRFDGQMGEMPGGQMPGGMEPGGRGTQPGGGLVIEPQEQSGEASAPPGDGPGGYFAGGERMGPMGPDSPETENSVRYFSIRFDAEENAETIAFRMSAVTEEEATEWAKSLLSESTGWTRGTYRYRVANQGTDRVVIVIDQGREMSPTFRILIISVVSLLAGTLISFLVLQLAAKTFFRPVEEADRKQKQFMNEAESAFKVPLTVVAAETELMERESGANAHTESIRRQVEKMSTLVRGIQALSVLEEEAGAADVDLSALLSLVTEEKRKGFAARGMALTADISEKIVVKGDEEVLRGILEEALENARKFGKTKAFIRLAKEGERVLLTAENDTDLPDGEQEKIFDRFIRLENAAGQEGAGLGLSFIRGAVRARGGRVSARVTDGLFRLSIGL